MKKKASDFETMGKLSLKREINLMTLRQVRGFSEKCEKRKISHFSYRIPFNFIRYFVKPVFFSHRGHREKKPAETAEIFF
jgi:hypothetical protein